MQQIVRGVEMTRTWLFGEAEYESTETRQENFERLFNTAECCGYMVNTKNFRNGCSEITMEGSDLESVRMLFRGDKILSIKKVQMTDRNGKMELYSKEDLVVSL